EIIDWSQVAVHPDVAAVVDAILRGQEIAPEVRVLDTDGEMRIERRSMVPEPAYMGTGLGQSMPVTRRRPGNVSTFEPREERQRERAAPGMQVAGPAFGGARFGYGTAAHTSSPARQGAVRVFPFGVSRTRLEQAVRGVQLPVTVEDRLESAHALI